MTRPADVRRQLLDGYRRARALRELPDGAPRAGYRIGPVRALAADERAVDDEPGTGKLAPASTSTSADVYLFGEVGGWTGFTAADLVRDVAPLDVDRLVVHINSGGGDAAEGLAVANVLRAHRATVEVRVDGIAASAASVIAVAADTTVMGVGSVLMVHDASGVALGSAAEMRKATEMLDTISDALASTYAAKAGGTVEQWREVMVAETWFTAEEAVAAGLADRVAAADETGTAEGQQITPGQSTAAEWELWGALSDPARFDLSAYRYPGRDAAPAPAMPGRTPIPDQEDDVKLDALRTRLGLPADADEAAVLAALDTRLTGPAPDAPPQEPADRAELARLRAVEADHQRGIREGQVDAAIRTGAIPPAKRGQWLATLEADPSMATVLAGLPAGLVPVDKPIGHNTAGAIGHHDQDQTGGGIRAGADLYRSRHRRTA